MVPKIQHCIKKTLKILIEFTLSVVFMYWSLIALDKYLSQPTSTHTSYTRGDDDLHVVFPHFTIYQAGPEFLEHCRKSSHDTFVQMLQNCMTNDPDFDIDKYTANITINMTDLVLVAELDHGDDRPLEDVRHLFYSKFHPKHGPCVEFDSDGLKIHVATANEHTELTFGLNLAALGETGDKFITFHSDLDGSNPLNPLDKLFFTSVGWGYGKADVKLMKKFISRESTRLSPCGEFSKETCHEIKGNQKIAKILNCKVPFLNSGLYLQTSIGGYNELPDCDKQVLEEALDIYIKTGKECKESTNCNSWKISKITKYTFGKRLYSEVKISFADFVVEHDISTISYSFSSLIAEIGGLLGMTLGLSGSSIFSLIVNLLHF